MQVFVPAAPCHNEAKSLRRGLDSLAGKVVGVIDNSKHNFNFLADELSELLVSKYGVSKVVRRRKIMAGVPAPDVMVQELAAQCDAIDELRGIAQKCVDGLTACRSFPPRLIVSNACCGIRVVVGTKSWRRLRPSMARPASSALRSTQ